jgi:transcriptional regulator with XRE-family HTH domain
MEETMPKPRLDVQALCDALDQQRRARKLSWRQVAAEVGVGSSTLSRMTKGHRPDVDSFAALVDWLGVPADGFLRGQSTAGGGGKRETLAVLSTHLRADKNLSPETVDALQDLLGAVERLMDAGGKLPEDGNGR